MELLFSIIQNPLLLLAIFFGTIIGMWLWSLRDADNTEIKETEICSGGDNAKVTVLIHWCGGCGFQSRFEETRDIILKHFPVGVKIISRQDVGVTGNFEIYVKGYLVQSLKKQQGFMHNDPARQRAVFAAIEIALEDTEE